MATFRVGVGSFNIKDSAVGIGTETTGHGNLKVEGTLKSNSMDVLGVSTFTRYSGFSADDVSVSNRDLTLSGEYSTTGDVVVEDGASLKVGVGSTACIGTVESVNVKNHFSVPAGDTNQRNESTGYSEGVIRFNSDLISIALRRYFKFLLALDSGLFKTDKRLSDLNFSLLRSLL